jgi:flagellin
MSNAINTIQAADNGITAITKLVQSAQSLASQAKQTSVAATRLSLAGQFDALLTQIGQLAGDAGFNGVNLLGGDTLTVNFNEDGSSKTIITGGIIPTRRTLRCPSPRPPVTGQLMPTLMRQRPI